jgi:hypothetical protein
MKRDVILTDKWACPHAYIGEAYYFCLNIPHSHTHSAAEEVVPTRHIFKHIYTVTSKTLTVHDKANWCLTVVLYKSFDTHLICVYSFSRHLETARRPGPSYNSRDVIHSVSAEVHTASNKSECHSTLEDKLDIDCQIWHRRWKGTAAILINTPVTSVYVFAVVILHQSKY